MTNEENWSTEDLVEIAKMMKEGKTRKYAEGNLRSRHVALANLNPKKTSYIEQAQSQSTNSYLEQIKAKKEAERIQAEQAVEESEQTELEALNIQIAEKKLAILETIEKQQKIDDFFLNLDPDFRKTLISIANTIATVAENRGSANFFVLTGKREGQQIIFDTEYFRVDPDGKTTKLDKSIIMSEIDEKGNPIVFSAGKPSPNDPIQVTAQPVKPKVEKQ